MTTGELHRYKDALSTWLGEYPWTHWATFTSAFERSPASWRRFMERLQKDLLLEQCFWGVEANDVRPHVHALLGPSGTDPSALFAHRGWSPRNVGTPSETEMIWRFCAEANAKHHTRRIWDPINRKHKTVYTGKKTLGRTHVDRYDPKRGAAYYVGKYVTKELNDYDLWTRRRRFG